MSLSNIQSKIETLLFNYLIKEGHVIEDTDGYSYNYKRYTFIDLHSSYKSTFDLKTIDFLNDSMDVIADIHAYIKMNHQSNMIKPPLEEYQCDMDIMNDQIDSIQL